MCVCLWTKKTHQSAIDNDLCLFLDYFCWLVSLRYPGPGSIFLSCFSLAPVLFWKCPLKTQWKEMSIRKKKSNLLFKVNFKKIVFWQFFFSSNVYIFTYTLHKEMMHGFNFFWHVFSQAMIWNFSRETCLKYLKESKLHLF